MPMPPRYLERSYLQYNTGKNRKFLSSANLVATVPAERASVIEKKHRGRKDDIECISNGLYAV